MMQSSDPLENEGTRSLNGRRKWAFFLQEPDLSLEEELLTSGMTQAHVVEFGKKKDFRHQLLASLELV